MKVRACLVVAAMIALALFLSRTIHPRHPSALETTAAPVQPASIDFNAAREVSPPLGAIPSNPVPMEPPRTAATNWLERLLAGDGEETRLPRAFIDRWLASGRTNAEDLLAARQAGGGIEFLHMALTNFPNDPRVLFAAIALEDGPEAKRQRLDRFKAAAPDNGLVDYLSARDHFKNGRSEEGLADLMSANSKKGFDDYGLDAVQNAEDLYLQSGKGPAEAKALATSSALLPQLAQMKGLAQDIASLQRQYLDAGDPASAERLGQMGVQLGYQLSGAAGARSLISDLVGIAVERIVLNPLDADRSYDFLQETPRERMAQLTARRTAAKEDVQFINQWARGASDATLISYFDRVKIYGESKAMEWIRQRQPADLGP
ncbi:MAG: hypothetical protein QOF48_1933 [Verrucomicrobiota bacterium]